MTNRVIVIDDDPTYCRIIKQVIKDSLNFMVDTTQSESEMYRMMAEARDAGQPYTIATIDMDFKIKDSRDDEPQEQLGRQILIYIKTHFPDTVCIMISGAAITPTEVLMLRDNFGLDFFINKTRFEPTIFKMFVEHAMKHRSRHGADTRSLSSNFSPRSTSKKVFISYRRRNTWGQARAIANSLKEHGMDVFLDIDSIGSGEFPAYIIKAIVEREYFILLLTTDTLESEWVQKEVDYALTAGRKVIPVLLDGFEMNEQTIPARFSKLFTLNGIKFNPETYTGDIERLVRLFLAT